MPIVKNWYREDSVRKLIEKALPFFSLEEDVSTGTFILCLQDSRGKFSTCVRAEPQIFADKSEYLETEDDYKPVLNMVFTAESINNGLRLAIFNILSSVKKKYSSDVTYEEAKSEKNEKT